MRRERKVCERCHSALSPLFVCRTAVDNDVSPPGIPFPSSLHAALQNRTDCTKTSLPQIQTLMQGPNEQSGRNWSFLVRCARLHSFLSLHSLFPPPMVFCNTDIHRSMSTTHHQQMVGHRVSISISACNPWPSAPLKEKNKSTAHFSFPLFSFSSLLFFFSLFFIIPSTTTHRRWHCRQHTLLPNAHGIPSGTLVTPGMDTLAEENQLEMLKSK